MLMIISRGLFSIAGRASRSYDAATVAVASDRVCYQSELNPSYRI
jgi:hypothetical protein